MSAAVARLHRLQRRRWDRLQVSIRCGLCIGEPARLRRWLGLGCWLVRQGALDELDAAARSLRLLLNTALDAALPWHWRLLCIDHAPLAAAPLLACLELHDPVAAQALRKRIAGIARGVESATPRAAQRV